MHEVRETSSAGFDVSVGGGRFSPVMRYLRVFGTFARNSLVRDMTFRSNFIIDCITTLSWMSMNLAFYVLVFHYTSELGSKTGWGKYQFYVFLATTLLINGAVQGLFMQNCEEFSELVRTGGLDFALLKPIDAQFLISLHKIEWSSLSNLVFALGLMSYSFYQLGFVPNIIQILLYGVFLVCGVAMLYSLMIFLATTSIWLGRNQSLYDFWFYITNFSRYPMEIYRGSLGTPLQLLFTFIIPVLVVVNVPARILAKPLESQSWPLAAFAIVAAAGSMLAARWVFNRAMLSYRSASS